VPAILTDGVNGLLVPCNDHEAAAGAMVRLLEDPDLSQRVAGAAFDGCAQYQWSAVRRQWVDLYRGLAEPSMAAAATPA
jgi:glycosyltransferase involved in cell wall biosynthesis